MTDLCLGASYTQILAKQIVRLSDITFVFVETKVRKTFQAIVPSVVIVPSATVPSDSNGLSRCNYCRFRQHSRRIVAALQHLQLTFAFKCSGVNEWNVSEQWG